MIAVIADDFTGAAELAGISLRYGLKVDVFLKKMQATNAEVVIVCTDSRSLNSAEAIQITREVMKDFFLFSPRLVYKKIDSVLRGHVVEEIKIQMEETGSQKALIVPANPSLGRNIRNGEYFIEGKKISETGFANDPEFPVKSSSVIKMAGDDHVRVVKYSDKLPDSGIVIGEAIAGEDIRSWIKVIDGSWTLAGAGDFYTALLEKQYKQQPQAKTVLQSPHLYVCGTAFGERKEFIKKLDKELHCVSWLPETVNEEWIENTAAIVREQNRVIIAIDKSFQPAFSIRSMMAKAVKSIMERQSIKEIFIEGGSTAAAVIRELGIVKMYPVNELARGVVRMKANNLFITMKPGSYELPAEILNIYSSKTTFLNTGSETLLRFTKDQEGLGEALS